MKLDFDSQRIDIACPHCQHKFAERLGRLKRDPQLTCPACAKAFGVEASSLRKALKSAQRGADELGRALGKFGK